jgi:hypothetical protein
MSQLNILHYIQSKIRKMLIQATKLKSPRMKLSNQTNIK